MVTIAYDRAMQRTYVYIAYPPFITPIVHAILYGIGFRETIAFYGLSLLVNIFSFFMFFSFTKTLYETLAVYKFNHPAYFIPEIIISILLGFIKEKKNDDKNLEIDDVQTENENKEEKEENKSYVLMFLLIFFTLFFMCSTVYIQKHFIDIEPDQVLFHLTVDVVGDQASLLFRQFMRICVYIPLAGTAMFGLFFLCFPNGYVIEKPVKINIPFNKWVVLYIIFAFSFFSFFTQTCAYKFFSFMDNPFIKDHYADPLKIKMTWPERKRNLIFLCLESMESSFASKSDGGSYNENYIPNLTKIAFAPGNVHFSHTDKLGGGARTSLATWSIAGAFAMWSGLPMKCTGFQDNNIGYLPGAVTALDLMNQQGYDQYLVFGHNNAYGVSELYETHGNFTWYDAQRVRDALPKYANQHGSWGVSDFVLYEMAKKIIKDHENSTKPFNLVINTLDTHFENGYTCEKCIMKHDYQYYDVMNCADRQVNDFINYLKTLPIWNDTTVIMIGDHHTMSVRLTQEMLGFDRRIYNAIVNPAIMPQKNASRNRKFLTFDWYPTILASLGVKIEGERLGLGTNLFSGRKTIAEEVGYEVANKTMQKASYFFNEEIMHICRDNICIKPNATFYENSTELINGTDN